MFYKISKRILDLVISITFWIILSPFMFLISLVVKMGDGGEIFVGTPVRVSVNGKKFFMYKFRTMVPNAHGMVSFNVDNSSKNSHKIIGDSRITRVGKFLRRWDLDELPQLINVILGQMSLVGPRPFYTEEIDEHLKEFPEDSEYFKKIFTIKPGLTGLWQVSGRNEISFRDRLVMEAKYVESRNLFEDIWILIQTPYVILTGKGKIDG